MTDLATEGELRRATARLGEVVLGRYQLERVIGCGGVGVVFQALDVVTEEVVAIKTLRDDIARVSTAGARFLREARIAHTLRHPAVPGGLATGLDGSGQPLLVMEFVSGEDFGARLERSGRLPVAEALLVGARVAEALDAAHREGIVHRDIKPSNVMVLTGASIPGGVCVLDFGIAHCLDEPRLTATGMVFGSPEYMSPEQVRGELGLPASDLYSLGATLVHLLTGDTLYAGSLQVQMMAHIRVPMPDLRARRPELPVAVERLLGRLLEKDPARRPATAADVSRTLRQLAVAGSSGADTSELFARALPVDPRDVHERLLASSARLHAIVHAEARARALLIKQLIEVAARRLEHARLQLGHGQPEAYDNSSDLAKLNNGLTALDDDAADQAREAALEAEIATLRARARADQEELRAQIQDLQAQVLAEPRSDGGANPSG